MNSHLYMAEWLTELLDSKFKIGRFGFGLDPILDLLPIGGDVLAMCLGLYIIWVGYELGVPTTIKWQMFRNLILDFGLGLIPVVGTIGDAIFKSNQRNLNLLRQWLSERPTNPQRIEAVYSD